jgi:hypothetical protein
MHRIYLYLASRSKSGIKVITVLKGDKAVNSALTDLRRLNLPAVWEREIQRIITDHRMLYEPRVETAENYATLRQRLKERGFTNLPVGEISMLHLGDYAKAPKANTSSCTVRKTMIRKRKT